MSTASASASRRAPAAPLRRSANPAPQGSVSVAIAARPAEVWSVLTNVVAWPAWLPTVSRVQAIDGMAVELGNRFRIHQPGAFPATWIVTRLQPPRAFSWKARLTGLVMITDHVIEEGFAGVSLVRLRSVFAGPLAGLFGALVSTTVQRLLEREAESLRIRVEAMR